MTRRKARAARLDKHTKSFLAAKRLVGNRSRSARSLPIKEPVKPAALLIAAFVSALGVASCGGGSSASGFDDATVAAHEVTGEGTQFEAHRVRFVTPRGARAQAEGCAREYGGAPNGAVCWAFISQEALDAGPTCWTVMASTDDGVVVDVSVRETALPACPAPSR